MARSVSRTASSGYQSGWEGPGKVGNSAFSKRFPATRSAKRASAGAGNETVRQAACSERIAPQGRCNLVRMLHNHQPRHLKQTLQQPQQGPLPTTAGSVEARGD